MRLLREFPLKMSKICAFLFLKFDTMRSLFQLLNVFNLNVIEPFCINTDLKLKNFLFLVQQLIEKTNREKAYISDLNSKLNTISVDSSNLKPILPDTSMLSVQELYDNEKLIINENKLLEVSYFKIEMLFYQVDCHLYILII